MYWFLYSAVGSRGCSINCCACWGSATQHFSVWLLRLNATNDIYQGQQYQYIRRKGAKNSH